MIFIAQGGVIEMLPPRGEHAQGGPAAEHPTRQIETGDAAEGAMIGPYRLLQLIGHGGMG